MGQPGRVERLKAMLLCYAQGFGVSAPGLQRKVAAQLWRALPRSLTPAEAACWLDSQVSDWAFALLGQQVSASRVRTAFLAGGLDPLLLLRPHDGSRAYTALARQLERFFVQPVPPASPVAMPVQDLQRLGWGELLVPVAHSSPVLARAKTA